MSAHIGEAGMTDFSFFEEINAYVLQLACQMIFGLLVR